MHVVRVGGLTMQNPPVFMDRQNPLARDALLEALLASHEANRSRRHAIWAIGFASELRTC